MRLRVFFIMIYICVAQFCVSQVNFSYNLEQDFYAIPTTAHLLETVSYGGGIVENKFESHKNFISTDGLVEVEDSAIVEGIKLDFDFPFAGQYFDQLAISTKGYLVLGKSSEMNFTVFSDTLVETMSDTVLTNKNSYLISGIYLGKNYDNIFRGTVSTYKEGFPGGRKFTVEWGNVLSKNGKNVSVRNLISINENGDIDVHCYLVHSGVVSGVLEDTYGAFVVREGVNELHVVPTVSDSTSWDVLEVTSSNSFAEINEISFPGGLISGTPYHDRYYVRYKTEERAIRDVLPFYWSALSQTLEDSAYSQQDFSIIESEDSIATSAKFYWYSGSEDSLSYDVFLGVDSSKLEPLLTDLKPEGVFAPLRWVDGLVTLSLDTLAAGQTYYLRIVTKTSRGESVNRTNLILHTELEESSLTYCSKTTFVSAPLSWSIIEFVDMLFDPRDAVTIIPNLIRFELIPDTLTWTTDLRQGDTVIMKMGTIDNSVFVNAFQTRPTVYIDFNRDGEFDVQNELFRTLSESIYKYEDIEIVVPTNALPGKTRMRIYHSDTWVNPCDVEENPYVDFTVTISPSVQCEDFNYNHQINYPNCYGEDGSFEIIPTGGIEPYSITWNTELAEDTFFVLTEISSPMRHRAIITDSRGCVVKTSTLQMEEPTELSVFFDSESEDEKIIITGGEMPYELNVTGDTNLVLFDVMDTLILSDLDYKVGQYVFQLSDDNGCDTTIDVVLTTLNTSLALKELEPFPNPFRAKINIPNIEEVEGIQVLDYNGKVLLAKKVNGSNVFFDAEHLENGQYIIRINRSDILYEYKVLKIE